MSKKLIKRHGTAFLQSGGIINEDVQKLSAESEKAAADAVNAENKARLAERARKVAIERIQKANGMTMVDGIWGPKTQRKYDAIIAEQQRLADDGFYTGKVDGTNGVKTKEARAKRIGERDAANLERNIDRQTSSETMDSTGLTPEDIEYIKREANIGASTRGVSSANGASLIRKSSSQR